MSPRFDFPRPSVAAMAALILIACGGCTLFRPQQTSFDYQEARRDINGVRPVSFDEEESKSIWDFTLEDLAPEKVYANVKQASGQGPNPEIAKELFAQAEAVYDEAAIAGPQANKAGFVKAAGLFGRAAARWPDSALQEDALFMVGQCYFFADRYSDANETYEELIELFPNSRHLDQAEAHRFSIAQYWLQRNKEKRQSFYNVNVFDKTRPWRDTRGHAMRIFDKIPVDDFTGKLADDATLAAANAHFAAGKYVQADEYYTRLRTEFPRSEHQFAAHMQGLKAKLASYDGPDYSRGPLDEAEKLVKQMRRAFPDRVEKHRDELNYLYAQIRYRQAEREWKEARYYDMRREFGAARIRYQALIELFEETPFAERARQRLAATSERPDTPPQKLPWLVSMFPNNDPINLDGTEDKSNSFGGFVAQIFRTEQQEEAEFVQRASGEPDRTYR